MVKHPKVKIKVTKTFGVGWKMYFKNATMMVDKVGEDNYWFHNGEHPVKFPADCIEEIE